MNKKEVVVLGGGVAGLEFIYRLAKQDKNQRFNLTLIDRNALHIWKPMLHTFAAGSQSADEQSILFLTQAKRHGFLYQPGTVENINREAREITLAAHYDDANEEILPVRTVHYDYLIVAMGSQSNDFGIKGVKEFASKVDDLHSALEFRRVFTDQLMRSALLKQKYHLIIVGAGATGVELSGELIDQLKISSSYSNEDLMQYMDITVIQADDRVLPTFKPSISESVRQSMEKIGVKVLLSTSVSEVFEDHVMLQDGESLPADRVVWTAGIKAPDVLKTVQDVELTRISQLVVDPYFRVLNDDRIFAIGDCAYVKEAPLAPTAQSASQEALYLSQYFVQIIANNQSMIPDFKYVDRGSLVSIGQYASFGMFGRNTVFKGLEFRGLSAKVAHITLYRRHQMRILGIWSGLCAWSADQFRRWAKTR